MPRFKDYPDFTPDYTPRQIFMKGAFGGSYWRPIYSSVLKKDLKNRYDKFECLKSVPLSKLVGNGIEYGDKEKNYFGVKAGATLKEWESKHWIDPRDPYGWIEWLSKKY